MKSFLARLSLPRPLLNGQLIDWLILLLIVAVVAVIFRGWPTLPEAESWGTWGEWAGAIGGFAAAVAAVGVALWSDVRMQRKDRLAGAYEAYVAQGPLTYAFQPLLDIQQRVGRISLAYSNYAKQLAIKSKEMNEVQTQLQQSAVGDRASLYPLYVGCANQVSKCEKALGKLIEEYCATAKEIPQYRGPLDEVKHLIVAQYSSEIARGIVQARLHLDLAMMCSDDVTQRDALFLEIGKCLRLLDEVIEGAKRAAKFIERM